MDVSGSAASGLLDWHAPPDELPEFTQHYGLRKPFKHAKALAIPAF